MLSTCVELFILFLITQINAKYVLDCCRSDIVGSPTKLLKCANASAEQQVKDDWRNEGIQKIAVVSYATSNINNYAAYAFALNQAWAERNNYLLRLADPALSNYEPRDARWNKVMILQHALEYWAKLCDYIVWLDADLILLDVDFRVESVVGSDLEGELWVSRSTSTDLMNSGMLILRNSLFVRQWLLPTWWSQGNRDSNSDQEAFNSLYAQYRSSKGLDVRVVLLPVEALNSDPPAAVRQSSEAKVLHLMGNLNEYRSLVFRAGFTELCNNNIGPIRAQLGLSQPSLLAMLLQIYRPRLDAAFRKYEENLDNGYSGFEASSELGKLVTHYVEALAVLEAEWNESQLESLKYGHPTSLDRLLTSVGEVHVKLGTHPESTDQLRERLLHLLFRNIQAQQQFTFNNKEELAGLLFTIVDTGMPYLKRKIEILAAKQGQNNSRELRATTALADELIAHSKQLLDLSPSGRKPIALNLQSTLYLHRSNLARLADDTEGTINMLISSLRAKETEGDITSPRNLISISVMLADAYCRVYRFSEAVPYFTKAIEMHERLVGSVGDDGVQLGIYYHLIAQALASLAEFKDARKYASKAQKLFSHSADVPQLQQVKRLLKIIDEKTVSAVGKKSRNKNNRA